MKERPILFQGAMVRAILAGTKTQTRRAVKGIALEWLAPENFTPEFVASPENHLCPYGIPGDRLWVRETYYAFGRWVTQFSEKKSRDEWHFIDMTQELGLSYRYAAASDELPHMLGRKLAGGSPMWWKRPAIFMPRAASRIALDVTEDRVERLQDISEEDAQAEGIENNPRLDPAGTCQWRIYGMEHTGTNLPSRSYESLWDSINGTKAGARWDDNPWVWAVAFKRVDEQSQLSVNARRAGAEMARPDGQNTASPVPPLSDLNDSALPREPSNG